MPFDGFIHTSAIAMATKCCKKCKIVSKFQVSNICRKKVTCEKPEERGQNPHSTF